jgi:hypothetical protein
MSVVVVPMTILVILADYTAKPCTNQPIYEVQSTQGAQIASGWRMTYDVDAKVLVVYPVQPGRVFCDGYEPNGEYQPTPLTRMERKQ